jgi:UDP-N-acetylmuramoylalanine--D-glutamate ligase
MAVSSSLKGRKVVLVGVAPGTLACAKFLIKKGAQVLLVDLRAQEIVEPLVADSLDLSKLTLVTNEAPAQLFDGVNQVVLSSNPAFDLRFLEAARLAGIPIQSELEFVSQNIETPVIAIAGTNGKSTTAYLTQLILENSGKTVFSNSLSSMAECLNLTKPVDYFVFAVNSFQIETSPSFKPAAVALLNLTEDHLTRYPTFEAYTLANKELLKSIDATTKIVVNAQDPIWMNAMGPFASQASLFSLTPVPEDVEGAWLTKNQMCLRIAGGSEIVTFDLAEFRLRGIHNRENLMAASLLALNFGGTVEGIRKSIAEARSLPNRVEFVKRLNSVAFYNDAASSNPASVVRSLQAFTEPVILISGGRDKNADYTPLCPHIRQRVKNLILVGEAKEKMNRMIGDFTETFLVGTVEEAVILAYQKSRSGDVILMSPGCEPTDQFPYHAVKGDFFKRLVTQISQPRRPNVF